LNKPENTSCDIFIGEGLNGTALCYNAVCSTNIDIANRSGDYIDVIPKTHLGGVGALYLIEQILNAANTIKYQKTFK
jgi:hypothetical protein